MDAARVTNASLIDLANYCSGLQELDLSEYVGLRGAGLLAFWEKLLGDES